ncbi:KNOTTED1-like homeobox protein 6 isoform 1 [Hibiscus syriacus]|uniref:Nicotianamine synthase n=1 Tax=Hibiscus syriacus TaxID=106335 RepID=A0A6A2YEY0_HIBSY|nr:KNOTTED1-like homeobox protein 6 isoform 1 [Hibiscus syriacus]
MRSKLIRLCGEAEGHLENHFSTILASYENPLCNLDVFLTTRITLNSANSNLTSSPNTARVRPIKSHLLVPVLFPCPRSYWPLSPQKYHFRQLRHQPFGQFQGHPIEYDVVFLAALVGMDKDEKVRVIDHLAKYMSPGAILMLRSAHGARAFLYPVVDPYKQSTGQQPLGPMKLPNKFFDIEMFNPLLKHVNLMEELDIEEQIS